MKNEFNFQEVACKLYAILLDCPQARDCDRILLSILWENESDEVSGDFISAFRDGYFSNPETVCRMRRKLQEVHPVLRGEKWEVRHNLEGAVCAQLTFFDRW